MSKPKICHEEFVQSYNDYPSQDNEGYLPDRGGFKCGFFEAWRIQQEAIDKLHKAFRNVLQDVDDTLNIYEQIKKDSIFHKGIKAILEEMLKDK